MRVSFYTLGCKVNHYETAAMAELFTAAGHQVVAPTEGADVCIVNTCTVTAVADQKSRQMLSRFHSLNPGALVVAVGCYSEVNREAVSRLPGVGLVLGTGGRKDIVSLVEGALLHAPLPEGTAPFARRDFEELSAVADSRTRATLKIQDGCVSFCTYCAIPFARGALRSRSMDSCRRELTALVAKGYQEIVLTGIELSEYGKDLTGRPTLLHVIALADEVGVPRLRLGSLDPRFASEAFARACAKSRSLCHQFHLSLQSGSKTVLERMNRRYTPEAFLENARRLRAYMPDAAITTDVIGGFPGETEAEHQETLAFLEAVGFARIHAFPYSRRPGTKAADMPGQLSQREKARRTRELIALGEKLEAAFIDSQIGTVQQVLMEEDGTGYTGNYIRVRCKGTANELVTVRLTGREKNIAIGEEI
ncbi:MAG: tRNA (N(6)-L-threonylcarbamoyladenosine(37)-C(2))-methylthiotransferase MtaB [Clostridia bacterium]|nr:tRNA (N(6)-L-threonylcarbamoyladenosine(37)-C(2))-methylthiotransferase MtaB [Clostridia bacterium]